MVSFIKKINEKSKELKENISKTYYDAANNLFKYIDENNKKNITNTDRKIEEINKQIATIDEKIKYAIEELLRAFNINPSRWPSFAKLYFWADKVNSLKEAPNLFAKAVTCSIEASNPNPFKIVLNVFGSLKVPLSASKVI